MDELKKTLTKIAKLFNERNILWNVGGSMLLSHFGLHQQPHDIDIIVTKNDVGQASYVLEKLGDKKQVPKSDVFLSEFYQKYNIEGVEVDLIAGFKIKHSQGLYEYIPEFESTENQSGEDIVYACLEDWYILYQLMPKGKNKVDIIEEYFKKEKKADGNRVKTLTQGCLPVEVIKRTKRAI